MSQMHHLFRMRANQLDPGAQKITKDSSSAVVRRFSVFSSPVITEKSWLDLANETTMVDGGIVWHYYLSRAPST